MSNNALPSHGTLIQYEDPAAPGSWITVAELGDLTPLQLSRNTFETTAHNDDEDSFVVGLKRKGDLGFQIRYVPDDPTHNDTTGLLKFWADGTLVNWRVVWTNGAYWQFPGYVIGFQPSAPLEGLLAAECMVKPSGDMVFSS